MHFTYAESCAAVGYDTKLQQPKLEYKLIAYKDGDVIVCDNEITWKKYVLRERIATPESEKAYDKFWDNQTVLENSARNHFYSKLVEYFPELSDEQFYVCYSAAYDRGHSSGFDEVANYLEEYVEMCKNFSKCV